MAEYNHEVQLIKKTYTIDDDLNHDGTETFRTVLCKKLSVSQNEFYRAGQNGYKPSLMLVIHTYEYDDEQEVEFEGKRYKVIRTYEENYEELELTCEEKSGGY